MMPRVPTGPLLTALMALTGAMVTGAEEPPNLAPNPGFEQTDLRASGYGVQAKAEVVPDTPFEGEYCLRHEAVAGHEWNCVQMLGSIPVTPGKLYRLEVYCRNTLTAGKAFFGFREMPDRAGEGTIRYMWGSMPAAQSTWQPSALLLRPMSETVALQIYFRLPADAVGTVCWDAVRLTEVDDPFSDSQPALLRISPLNDLMVTLENGRSTPPLLPITLDASPDMQGGMITVRVTPESGNGDLAPTSTWETQQPIVSAGLLELVVPTAGLSVGKYRLSLEATSVDERCTISLDKPLGVIPAVEFPPLPPVRESHTGADGFLRVNGTPFLSILYYHNPLSTEGMTNLRDVYGVTSAQAWGGNSIEALCDNVDLVWEAGVYCWAVLFHPATLDMEGKRWKDAELIEVVERLKNHPGLIGWDLIDEPDGLGIPPDEVRRALTIVRERDPNHAIWVNYCLKDRFPEYAGLSDFASYDHYPLQTRPLGLLRDYNTAIRAAFPDRPLLSCLQTYAAPGMGMPTPAQLRAQVYLGLCEGMTLFHYYAWFDPPPTGSLASNPELRSSARLLTHELHALRPFLFSTSLVPMTLTGAPPDQVACVAKRVGENVQAVVVNLERDAIAEFRFAIDGYRIESAVPMGEALRPVSIENNHVVDHLPPYGVIMVELQVSVAGPIPAP